jgi:hypothetical protein
MHTFSFRKFALVIWKLITFAFDVLVIMTLLALLLKWNGGKWSRSSTVFFI